MYVRRVWDARKTKNLAAPVIRVRWEVGLGRAESAWLQPRTSLNDVLPHGM
jgi:hypothetical protein